MVEIMAGEIMGSRTYLNDVSRRTEITLRAIVALGGWRKKARFQGRFLLGERDTCGASLAASFGNATFNSETSRL